MKKAVLLVALTIFCVATAQAATMTVQLRAVDVKSQPNYMSASVGKLSYGAKVETGEEQGSWVRLSAPAGWIPKNAVTKRSVAVNADQKYSGKGTSHDETALAGKGFNPQVEAEYKRENPGLVSAYAKVDWMERLTVPQNELKAFAAAGGLK